jgi:hypothetical protein
VTLPQDHSAIQPFRQTLQYGAGDGIPVIYLPKGGRDAPVNIGIVVVVRPDSVSRGLKNIAPKYPKCEFNNCIEIMIPNRFQVGFAEIFAVLSFFGNCTANNRYLAE